MKEAFANRQTPAFDETGEHGEAAVLIDAVKFGVGQVVDNVDLAVEIIGAIKQVQQTIDPPALAPYEDQMRGLHAGCGKLPPGADDVGVILAAFNRRHIGDEGLALEGIDLRRPLAALGNCGQ